jgi:hypothetical protein
MHLTLRHPPLGSLQNRRRPLQTSPIQYHTATLDLPAPSLESSAHRFHLNYVNTASKVSISFSWTYRMFVYANAFWALQDAALYTHRIRHPGLQMSVTDGLSILTLYPLLAYYMTKSISQGMIFKGELI